MSVYHTSNRQRLLSKVRTVGFFRSSSTMDDQSASLLIPTGRNLRTSFALQDWLTALLRKRTSCLRLPASKVDVIVAFGYPAAFTAKTRATVPVVQFGAARWSRDRHFRHDDRAFTEAVAASQGAGTSPTPCRHHLEHSGRRPVAIWSASHCVDLDLAQAL
jgi:hypothetical protein